MDTPIRRPRLADQVEAALREGIRKGEWRGRLPGSRHLCQHFGVSPPTLAEALARLVRDRWISSAGPRHRFRIHPPPGTLPSSRPTRRKKVLFWSHDPIHLMSHTAIEILSRLLLRAGRKWDIVQRVEPFEAVRQPRRTWDRLVESERPDLTIVLSGRPAVALWGVRRRLPMVFLGGDLGGQALCSVAVRTSRMLEHVLVRLLALGHRHICMPMLGCPEGFVADQRETFSRLLGEAGLPFAPTYHKPSLAEAGAEALAALLERMWNARPPTALVVMAWREMVTIECDLRARGVRIPDDVSLVLLSEDASLPWFRPALAHFPYPVDPVARVLTRWIEQGLPPAPQNLVFPTRFEPGQSLAPPKA